MGRPQVPYRPTIRLGTLSVLREKITFMSYATGSGTTAIRARERLGNQPEHQ